MKKRWKILIAIVILLIAGRIYLPYYITDYVNKVLDDVPGYSGSISDVDLRLYRGAYKIYDLKMVTTGGDVPVPFLDIPVIDLSVEWSALFKGAIAGEITLTQPQLNFVMSVSDSTATEQTGGDADWTKPIKELMPISINRFQITNGSIHYLDFSTEPKVDIYIDSLNALATNFSNVTNSDNPLPALIEASGSSLGGGKLSLTCNMNPLMQIPDMDMEGRFENANIPAFNDFTQAYSKLDFQQGSLSVFSELSIKDGKFNGYVKPVINDLKVVDFSEDKKNPLGLLWESVAGLFIEIFENQKKDQFATRVPMQGDLNNTKTNIWPVLGNIFKNAFIEAFSKRVDDSIEFEENEE
ncbi:DUF748 domain-containing protein [Fulvivirga sp. RKSG066]|uniref:DUF748 domain-containing protein n=1 Tax=Fulvivirga aurantia TaxID=2529383 RepID=UPI0012BCAF2F|nr:DUF748 domain-containing protein [Fulvivirga aurantia]MTI21583.1 DUF748 domain-containing protein [Fulvivirga aurantia]